MKAVSIVMLAGWIATCAHGCATQSGARVSEAAAVAREAVLHDDGERLQALIRAGMKPDEPVTSDGHTALMEAARTGAADAVDTLIRAGAAVDYRDAKGLGALFIAAREGQTEVTAKLLNVLPDARGVDVDGSTALIYAALSGHLADVQLLIPRSGHLNHLNRFGANALTYAAAGGHLAIIEALLQAGADATKGSLGGKPALAWAARSNNYQAPRILLPAVESSPVAVDHLGAALVMSVAYKKSTFVRLLINHRHAPAVLAMYGPTALGVAAKGSSARILKMLLDKGVPVNWASRAGRTALMVAAYHGRSENVLTLLIRGADATASDSRRETALSIAASRGMHEVVATLIPMSRAVLDKANTRDGYTPLMRAAAGGHGEAVRLLLAAGANRSLKDREGRTAQELAELHEHEPVAALLTPRSR